MADEVIGVKAVLDLSQWSGNVKKVIDDTGNAEKSMGDMARTFNDKLKVVENSIGAVTAAVVVFDRAISQGEGIIQGKALFTSLAGGAQQAARGEEELAQATRGLVDDDIALAGASKLLSLGLADNVDQASQIVGLGTQLGRVFLRDAASGINAFNTALANTSARGLQQLGISYDEVEKRQKELERQGLSTRNAFREAMIEVATAVRDKLGDSVIMAGSALDRLKVKAQDTVDSVLEAAAVGFENTVNLVSLSVSNIGRFTDAAQRQVDALNTSAEATLRIVQDAQRTLTSRDFRITPGQIPVTGAVAGGAIVQQIVAQQRLNDSIVTSNRLEEMRNATAIADLNISRAREVQRQQEFSTIEQIRAANADLIRQEQQRAGIQEAANRSEYNQLEAMRAANADLARQQERASATEYANLERIRAINNDLIRQAQGRANIQAAASAAEYSNLERVRAAEGAALTEQQAAMETRSQAGDNTERQYDTLVRLQDQLTNSMLRGRGSVGGTMLFTDQDAANARNIANAAEAAFQQISDTKDKYPDLVSDADYQRMKGIYENSSRFADQAERGARAFDSMNLAQLLGQESGGPAGEIVSMIESSLGTLDLTADKLGEIKDAMELVTGQQTEASEALKNDIVPALAVISQGNATAAAQSAVAIQNYAQAQALAGQAVTEAGMLAAGGLGVNPNAGSRQIIVTAGQTATEAAQANNITVAQLLATTGALNVNSVPVGTFTMNGGTAVVPLQGPGTTFGGGEGTLAQQGGLIAPGGAATGPSAPLVNGQQEITDAATNIRQIVTDAKQVVHGSAIDMGMDMSTLNTTGQTQLTGETGLTAWWDQLQTKVQSVYNVINPLINQLAQGITQINSGAQNLNTTPATTPGPNPTTGRGYAGGGRITDTSFVGEHGRELFTPHRAGYIINAANTESILSALAGVLNSGGGNHIQNNQRSATINQTNYIQSNAQATSAMMDVSDALRGYA